MWVIFVPGAMTYDWFMMLVGAAKEVTPSAVVINPGDNNPWAALATLGDVGLSGVVGAGDRGSGLSDTAGNNGAAVAAGVERVERGKYKGSVIGLILTWPNSTLS